MAWKSIQYRWHWRLKGKPQAIWKTIGTLHHLAAPFGVGDNGVQLLPSKLAEKAAGFCPPSKSTLSWIQDEQLRMYLIWDSGPVRKLEMLVTIEEENGESVVRHVVDIHPNSFTGQLAIPYSFGKVARTAFDKLYHQLQQFLEQDSDSDYLGQHSPLPDAALKFLNEAGQKLADEGFRASWIRPFIQTLALAPDTSLHTLRPYILAKKWGIPRKRAVEMMMSAAHLNLLHIRWESRCPKCLRTQISRKSLDKVPKVGKCASCNIHFQNNLARNVELTFTPTERITNVGVEATEEVNPITQPFTVLHQFLEPSQVVRIDATIPAGRYRVRTLTTKPEHWITLDLAKVNQGELSVVASNDGLKVHFEPNDSVRSIRLGNRSTGEQFVFLEELGSQKEVLTVVRATNHQQFRRLFPEEVIRADRLMPADKVAILRIDVDGINGLSKTKGDQPFYLFLQEFEKFLEEIVDHYDGAVIRAVYNGAVTATFNHPGQATRAALTIMQDFDTFTATLAETERFTIKMGLHYGSCFAINLNNHLDYFGETMQLASLLPAETKGKAIVITEEMGQQQHVAQLLRCDTILAEEFDGHIEGFDAPVKLLSITGCLPE